MLRRQSWKNSLLILALCSPAAFAESTINLQIRHKTGYTLSGSISLQTTEAVTTAVSALDWLEVATEKCGIVYFQASMNGLICRNCIESVEEFSECEIPPSSDGWILEKNTGD